MSIDIARVVKETGYDERYIAPLLTATGVSRDEYEAHLKTILGNDTNPEVISITRMNIIGTARARGFEVEGGRRGRGQNYRITGWEKPAEIADASQWTGVERERLDRIHRLPVFTLSDREWLEKELAEVRDDNPRSPIYHEADFGYIWCYELAKDRAWVQKGPSGYALIIQRFPNYPRLRVFNISMDAEDVLDLAKWIAAASTKPVSILNPPANVTRLASGSMGERREAVYRLEDIAKHPEKFFNKRALTTLRKHERESQWTRLKYIKNDPIIQAFEKRVIDVWRTVNEPKQRQLAITRDYTAVTSLDDPGKDYHCLAIRGIHPVALHILTRIPGTISVVSQIVEKSLNYTSMPGGAPGTADFNLFRTAQYLTEHEDIEFLNAGGYTGGSSGLIPHKERFARPEDDVYSKTFYPNFPVIDMRKYGARE